MSYFKVEYHHHKEFLSGPSGLSGMKDQRGEDPGDVIERKIRARMNRNLKKVK